MNILYVAMYFVKGIWDHKFGNDSGPYGKWPFRQRRNQDSERIPQGLLLLLALLQSAWCRGFVPEVSWSSAVQSELP